MLDFRYCLTNMAVEKSSSRAQDILDGVLGPIPSVAAPIFVEPITPKAVEDLRQYQIIRRREERRFADSAGVKNIMDLVVGNLRARGLDANVVTNYSDKVLDRKEDKAGMEVLPDTNLGYPFSIGVAFRVPEGHQGAVVSVSVARDPNQNNEIIGFRLPNGGDVVNSPDSGTEAYSQFVYGFATSLKPMAKRFLPKEQELEIKEEPVTVTTQRLRDVEAEMLIARTRSLLARRNEPNGVLTVDPRPEDDTDKMIDWEGVRRAENEKEAAKLDPTKGVVRYHSDLQMFEVKGRGSDLRNLAETALRIRRQIRQKLDDPTADVRVDPRRTIYPPSGEHAEHLTEAGRRKLVDSLLGGRSPQEHAQTVRDFKSPEEN